MKKSILFAIFGCSVLPFALPSQADVLAYPAKGQSAKQQDKDSYECYNWAKQQTGFDPHAMAGTAPQQGTQPGGSNAVRGAARGAAAGAVGGAIAGDAGKGAAIGAGVGAVGGGARRRHEEANAQQQQQQAQAQQQQKLTAFNDAQGVCLKGRGYTVK
jgi:hypothetical protein